MKNGKRLEQPIPDTMATSCSGRPSRVSARSSAVNTPKSPQPGHHVGLCSEVKPLRDSWDPVSTEPESVMATSLVRVLCAKRPCVLRFSQPLRDVDCRERNPIVASDADHLDASRLKFVDAVGADHPRELPRVVRFTDVQGRNAGSYQ